MLNFLALGLLFSSLGAVMVLNPDPYLVRENDAHAQQSIIEAAEKLRQAADVVAQKAQLRQEDNKLDMHVGDKAAAFQPSIHDRVKDVAEGMKDTASQTAGTAKESAKGATESVKKTYKDVAEGMKDTASQTAGAAKESAKGDTESVKKTYKDAREGMQEKAKETLSYMPNVGEGIAWATSQEDSRKKIDQDGSKTGTMTDEKIAGVIDREAQLHRKVDEFCQWFHNETLGSSSSKKSLKEWICGRYDGTKERVENIAKATREKYECVVGAAKHMGGHVKEAAHTATEKMAVCSDDNRAEHVGTSSGGIADMKREILHDDLEKRMISSGMFGGLCSRNWTTGVDTMKHMFCSGLNCISSVVSKAVHSPVFKLLYLFSFSVVYGVSLWVTFVSGYVLSKSVPRHQFGYVQSKIFPVYLRMLSLGTGLCFLLYSLLHSPWASETAIASSPLHSPWPSETAIASSPSTRWQFWSLLFSLLSALANTFILEPSVTKVMVEKLKLEKEEGRGQGNLSEDAAAADNVGIDEITRARILLVDRKFRRLHNYSSLLNLATIIGLTWHLWDLANRVVI